MSDLTPEALDALTADGATLLTRGWATDKNADVRAIESVLTALPALIAAAREVDSCRADERERIITSAQVERDALAAQVAALTSALERTEANFRNAVAGHPVRDMTECLAENRAALNPQAAR